MLEALGLYFISGIPASSLAFFTLLRPTSNMVPELSTNSSISFLAINPIRPFDVMDIDPSCVKAIPLHSLSG